MAELTAATATEELGEALIAVLDVLSADAQRGKDYIGIRAEIPLEVWLGLRQIAADLRAGVRKNPDSGEIELIYVEPAVDSDTASFVERLAQVYVSRVSKALETGALYDKDLIMSTRVYLELVKSLAKTGLVADAPTIVGVMIGAALNAIAVDAMSSEPMVHEADATVVIACSVLAAALLGHDVEPYLERVKKENP